MQEGKRIFIVSTGRCGTKRIAEILHRYLPPDCTVIHQTKYSRLANVVGNLIYHFPAMGFLGDVLYSKILNSVSIKNHTLVSVDPLSSMVIPESIVKSDYTFIIHVIRNPDEFALSMYRLSRSRIHSFIAHNFIPLWQPHLFPLQNIISRKIIDKYKFIHFVKNNFFYERYSCNKNYMQVNMENIFKEEILSGIISSCLGVKIYIPFDELSKKSNESS